MLCHATCGAAFHPALSSPYLPVPSYPPVSIRSRLLSSFCTRCYPSLSRLRQPRFLSPLTLSPTLARTILSIFRHRLLEKIFWSVFCHCFHYLLPPSPPPLLQGIAPVTLLWTKARSWHSLDAARSSGKVALGAYNVRCKTD